MFTTFRLWSTAPATPTPSNNSTPSILQSISETPSTPCNSPHRATKKRSREDQDKNLPFASSAPPKKRLHTALQATPSLGAPTTPWQYTPCQTKHEKLNSLFDALDAAHWTLAEFLYYTFRTKDEHRVNIHCTVHCIRNTRNTFFKEHQSSPFSMRGFRAQTVAFQRVHPIRHTKITEYWG